MVITTTDFFEGRRIVEYKGLVRVTSIHSVAATKDLRMMGCNISGGRAEVFEDEVDSASSEAHSELQDSAEKLGANSAVGAAVNAYGIGANGAVLLVTLPGTAVVVE